MTLDETLQYIGMQYDPQGNGPTRWNCWNLLRHIQTTHFGRALPAMPIGDATATRGIHTEAERAGAYWPILVPLHGDAVLLRGGDTPHVGVWLNFDNGGVLHAMEGYGVIYTQKTRLNLLGFGRLRYYRVKDGSELRQAS